jgi:hypothetical protein
MSDIFVNFSYTAAKIEILKKTQQTGHFLILAPIRLNQFSHQPQGFVSILAGPAASFSKFL